MSDSNNKAVFLSYASQDTAAARRVCDALRSAGIEVWFDADSALEHGDEWDAKIRRQIRECVFFIPIVSASTQARPEGYFRLEWDLAAERARSIASGVPFILPIAIDQTREQDALVPDRFRTVQWTRLPGGEVPVEISARFLKLWVHRTGLLAHQATVVEGVSAMATGEGPKNLNSHSASPSAAQPPPDFAPAKSVAVLPFANMSSDKENEYLSDGITEEILTALSKVPGLRVPARTSAFVFKERKEDVRKIGELLNVATVLEGSVRKSGNRLRIAATLSNAADGYEMWRESYDREMTDIFAIQDDIARAIVEKLKITLAGGTRLGPARHQVENVEAFEWLLRGRFHLARFSEPDLKQAIACFEQALVREPDYALAYAGLARAHGTRLRLLYAAPAVTIPLQRAAVARALALDDTLPDAHGSLADLLFWVDRNKVAAEREYRRTLELAPADAETRMWYSLAFSVLGRHAEAIAEAAKARQLDPLSVSNKMAEAWVFFYAKNFDRALAVGREVIALAPDNFFGHQVTGRALFSNGCHNEGIAHLEESRRIADTPYIKENLSWMYAQSGRNAEARTILDELLAETGRRYIASLSIAGVYQGIGDYEQANVWMNKAIEDRDGGVMYLKVADEIYGSNPHYPEWLKKVGLDG
ncbi:MAG: TIR domain-containing protein [Opitutus sp.]|nr:TIR domain-containing protein [Opitutus sp.]